MVFLKGFLLPSRLGFRITFISFLRSPYVPTQKLALTTPSNRSFFRSAEIPTSSVSSFRTFLTLTFSELEPS